MKVGCWPGVAGIVDMVVAGLGRGGLANEGPTELWKPSAEVIFWTVEGVGRTIEVASLVTASFGGAANSLLKRPWPIAMDLLGEWKMRMSQRRSCLLPPEAVGWGLVERREVSIASSLSNAFLYALRQLHR